MEKENFLSNKAIRVCLAHQLYITNIKIKLNYIYIYSLYKIFFFIEAIHPGKCANYSRFIQVKNC